MKKSVKDISVNNKRVLVRVDFNVPMSEGKITSTIRVDEALVTINYLLKEGAKVVLCSHLGRPDGQRVAKYSLKPVYEYLKTVLPNTIVKFCDDCVGKEAETMSKELKAGEVLLLENLRYHAEEEENNEEFTANLAKLADIYVNDAFGTAHRKHASTYGVAKLLPSVSGLLMAKELESFSVLDDAKRPFVAILGGAKIGDKIEVTKNLLKKVDVLLIGGGMCYTFLKAIKMEVGKSLVNDEMLDFCFNVMKEAIDHKVKIVLPIDFVCSTSIEDHENVKVYKQGAIPQDYMSLDIGPKTCKLFHKYIKRAKTVVWNGPMGVYEVECFSHGTESVAKSVASNKRCFSIIGGGDVVSAVEKFDLADKISHISTGGGASLKLLEGKQLAAVTVLQDK